MFDIADSSNESQEMNQQDSNSTIVQGAKIKVIGVGGGGCNAVNTMIRAGLNGVEYIVANTDSQALAANMATSKIQLGGSVTKGLGAGANPEVGRKSAIEDYEKLSESLDGADMIFITAGMGGGTGTGAAPVIAKLARELGALTVGVVTKPFLFEGKKRSRQAQEGIRELEDSVDSLICIPNQKLLQLAGENLSLVDTFKAADEVLLNAVQGISDLINNTGLINADFADVATVMTNKGLSLMGSGVATGSDRALKAAKEAISSPLLEDVSITGATGIIINITGDHSLTTHETNQAVTLIMEAADEEAEIIFGTVIDESMGDSLKVTVIATGLQVPEKVQSINPNTTKPTSSKTEPVANQAVLSAHQSNIEKNHVNKESQYSSHQTLFVNETTNLEQKKDGNSFESSQSLEDDRKEFEEKKQTMISETSQMTKDQILEEDLSYQVEKDVEQKMIHHFDDTRHDEEDGLNSKKINWAEKLQNAASQYESQKKLAENNQPTANENISSIHENHDFQRTPHQNTGNSSQNFTSNPSREKRIKSIAEKLGFFNFDEDEFDTPSYMKRGERGPDPQI